VLYIDEAQLLFNSREWQSKERHEWLTFFTQHRHFGYDIILVAQFDRMLDRQIRGLIEYDYVHRKINRAGRFGAFLGFMTGGNLFVMIKNWYPISEKVSSEFFLGNKKLYDLYDSYNCFSPVSSNSNTALIRSGRIRSG
jgi:zona occludens toxin (predicted ATPase)